MKREKETYWIFLIFTLFFIIFCSTSPVYSEDELYLTGIVKEVDFKKGVVTVEVLSKTCSGIKTFQTEDIEKLLDSEGKKISFFINTSTCIPNEIYTMHGCNFHKEFKK
ncbi:MAG: hypothetical protein HXY53_10295 [Nitrospirae bacterium]|nr:hypothetical protein [Nitrospirota bacterium]